jgi:hypothetical protein
VRSGQGNGTDGSEAGAGVVMRLLRPAFAFSAACLICTAASACSIEPDARSPQELRAESKAVAVDRQCRAINAGVHDNLSLGPVTNLGDGRVQQVLGGNDQSNVLVADCNTREVTILQGKETIIGEDSCGPISSYADLAGENAMMSLSLGANLHELVDLATAQGVTEINPQEYFFMFATGWESRTHKVGRKDRFDLLCGCKLYYPDSAGATK